MSLIGAHAQKIINDLDQSAGGSDTFLRIMWYVVLLCKTGGGRQGEGAWSRAAAEYVWQKLSA